MLTRSSARRLLAGAVLAAAAAFSPAALAGVPMTLPAGEPAAAWEQAFALGGFSAGTAATGPLVTLTNQGDYWLLRVRDASGKVQEVNVLPPASPQDREDIVWLAMSLLKPAGGGSTWSDVPTKVDTPPPLATATPAPEPVTPAPTPAKAKKPASTPVAASVPNVEAGVPPAAPASPPVAASASPAAPPTQPVAASVAPATPASTATVAQPASGPSPWVVAGGGIGWRPYASVGGDVEVAGGVSLGALRVGAGLSFRPAAAIPEVGEGRTVGAFDVEARGAYRFGDHVSPLVGVAAGVSMRSFADGGEAVGNFAIPLLGVDAGVIVPVKGGLGVLPYASLRADLRSTQLSWADRAADDPLSVSPIDVKVGVAVTWSGGE